MKPAAKELAPAALALMMLLTGLVYLPGLQGDFFVDDIPNIVYNERVAIGDFAPGSLEQALTALPAPFPANRPLSMLSFGINHALSGFDPFFFKLTNLFVHLASGLAAFFLTWRLVTAYGLLREIDIDRDRILWLSVLVAAAWMLHPLNLSPVLYVVQRMTSLSALFSMAALTLYANGRVRMHDGRGGRLFMLAGLLGFGPLAFLCKENAVLLPSLMLVTEVTLFGFVTGVRRDRRFLIGLHSIFTVLPILAFSLYVVVTPEWIVNGYQNRNFDLQGRLLTEPRVIWFYLRLLFLPELKQFGIFHDDIAVSEHLLDPPTTLASILGLSVLTAVALVLLKRLPMLSFGILFFLVGHSLESGFIALELAFEHRNYLPSYGPVLCVFYALFRWRPRGGHGNLPNLAGIGIVLVLASLTALRAHHWGSADRILYPEAAYHPDSPQSNQAMGQDLKRGLFEGSDPTRNFLLAQHFFSRAAELSKNNCHALFSLVNLYLYVGKRPPPQVLDLLEQRLERIPFSPQNVHIDSFSKLVLLHINHPELPLESKDVLRIFDAALKNPTLDRVGHGYLYSAMREYYHKRLGQPQPALKYGRLAIASMPADWFYREKLIRLLIEAGDADDARLELERARADTEPPAGEAAKLAALIEQL